MADINLPAINSRHRYIVRSDTGEWVSSTNDLGMATSLPLGFGLIDTIGVDGLGTINGNKGIPAFLRARKRGRPL